MATMYVGGGLYLPTTGTASKPKTTSTPTGGTVTVAQRNAIASTKKPATTTVAKKPTTNTLSSMAGSSLGTTSRPASSPTASLVSGSSSSSSSSRNTVAQNAAVASLLSGAGTRSPTTNPLSTMAGRTLGINAALPQPPQLTKAQIGNRFTQSLAAGAKTGAAVPNPAGLTRDEADTFRSRFYTDFYSGKPVQRIDDTLVPMTGRGIAAPTLTEKYASANPVNQLGYAPVSGSVGRVFNSPGNYAPENFAYSVQRAKEMTAPPERTPQWDKSLRALADTAYRGFMAPSRALNGYYDQFTVDPDTGNLWSFDPRMIDDAAALAGFAQTGGVPLVGPRVAAAVPRAAEAGISAVVPQTARLPAAANLLDEGFVQRAAELNDQRLLANMMRENDARSLTSAIDENDALVLRNAMRENDTLNALNTAREARPARGGELFPDITPAATVSDPMDVLRPVFMSADEAADVIRPGPRVAADAGMDPITKRLLIAAGGAGVALPGLAGLSLLANGQFAPAPTATTPPAPKPGGIDVAASGAPRSARALRQAQINQNAANLGMPAVPQLPGSPAATSDEQARLEQQVAAAKALQDELGISADPASFDPTAYPTVNSPGQVELVGAEDVQPVDRPAITTSTDKARYDELFETGGTGDTPLIAGEEPVSVTGGTSTPAAGKKFTPGPGQFVGTNGYIYEQSSDGSFEQVGRVPGYTPAQLYEAANKGAFRDPNNIVTGGAKPKKKARKKGEKNFIDKAGDILKERFDDSLFAQLFLNQDDEAAPETAATGPEAVEYYSTPPSSVPESLVSSSGSGKKRKKKDEDETDGGTGTGGTGTGGTGTGTYTPPTQAMLDALYAPYMRQYTGPGAGYVPGVSPEWNYFTPAFADGGLVDGRLVLGDGGPKEDKIPAMIDGVEQAKLSNGEFVMTAAAVKNAGGGDIELGAKRLMDLNNMLSYGQPAERLKVQHVK